MIPPHEGLQTLQARHETIDDLRGGHGLMLALELVGNRDTKAPIDKPVAGRVQEETYRAGAMVRVSARNITVTSAGAGRGGRAGNP